MAALQDWWDSLIMPWTVLPVALFCAVLGAAVLSLFTRWLGMSTLLINVLALFVGAYLANLLTNGMHLQIDRFYLRPVIMSFVGMAVTSLVVLLVFVRNGRNE